MSSAATATTRTTITTTTTTTTTTTQQRRRKLATLNPLERKALQERATRREHVRRATKRAQRLEAKLRARPRIPPPAALEEQLQTLRRLCAKNEAEVDYGGF